MTAMGTATSHRLRERKRARTRVQIRERALRLCLEHGYEATAVQAVANAAEVALSTLLRSFPTKAQLVLPFDLAAVGRQGLEDGLRP